MIAILLSVAKLLAERGVLPLESGFLGTSLLNREPLSTRFLVVDRAGCALASLGVPSVVVFTPRG
jgi:hypothetical protein